LLELSVCIGSACHIKGSYNVIQSFQQLIEEYSLHDKIELKATFCLRQCQNKGVAVAVGDKTFNLMPEQTKEFFINTIMPMIYNQPAS